MDRYVIGVDYGTLSARAVVVNVKNGQAAAQSASAYAHGVMDRSLPDGTALGSNWALQAPQDYLNALYAVVPEALRKAQIPPEAVIGISLDFTSCTLLPVDAALQPLCFRPEWQSHPHAWVKLWKHHAAQKQADRLNATAQARQDPILDRFGGRINAEMAVPKLMQMLQEDPALLDAAAYVMEAGDWLSSVLAGSAVRSACFAGFKSFWRKESGYPSDAFLNDAMPGLAAAFQKLRAEKISPVGTRAGQLCEEQARKLGLCPGIAVGVPVIDAHAGVPAAGIRKSGDVLLILGTSACDLILSEREITVPGIFSAAADGILPGLVCYEAGQSCVGDLFDWFIRNWVPGSYEEAAVAAGKNIHAFLSQKASCLRPGESGLVSLDWWNGNRSILNDASLTGLIAGMTLETKPEEVYRALIEATAFGQRVILENMERSGVQVGRIIACGGIAQKNPMLVQIYADVLKRPILVSSSDQAPALGSAMFAAAAAGRANGGYDTIFEAIDAMQADAAFCCEPDKANGEIYDKLYGIYRALHDTFGAADSLLRRLRQI
ncbi:MAG: ribulokinase [Clostridia bacterium]|nr:ribulokinase [Clostridia bacterium]